MSKIGKVMTIIGVVVTALAGLGALVYIVTGKTREY